MILHVGSCPLPLYRCIDNVWKDDHCSIRAYTFPFSRGPFVSLSLSPIPSRYPRSKRTINAKIKTMSSLDISCRINTRMLNIANRFRPSKVISGQIVQQPQEITDGETVAENKQFQFPFTSITVNRRQSLI